MNNLPVRHCSICMASERRRVGAQSGWEIWECSHCAFHYATPAGNAAQPNYEAGYFDAFIRRDDSEEWHRFYRATLASIRRYSPGLRLLDAGSGASMFSPTARQEGWDVTAVDGSEAAINYLKQHFDLPAKVADLNDRHALEMALGPTCEFDAVNSFHVIEHLARPDDYLAGIYDVLVPGGCLHLGLPIYPWNIFKAHEALLRAGLANHPFNLGLPDHVCFFDRRTINRLLQRMGFRVESVTRSGFVSVWDIAQRWSDRGAIRGVVRGLTRAIAPLTSRVGVYNHLIIIAKKPNDSEGLLAC